MKKLVFTALAVVAFSGVSMAKTIEAPEKDSEIQTKLVEEVDCYGRAMNILDKLEVSPVEAYEIWMVLTANC